MVGYSKTDSHFLQMVQRPKNRKCIAHDLGGTVCVSCSVNIGLWQITVKIIYVLVFLEASHPRCLTNVYFSRPIFS